MQNFICNCWIPLSIICRHFQVVVLMWKLLYFPGWSVDILGQTLIKFVYHWGLFRQSSHLTSSLTDLKKSQKNRCAINSGFLSCVKSLNERSLEENKLVFIQGRQKRRRGDEFKGPGGSVNSAPRLYRSRRKLVIAEICFNKSQLTPLLPKLCFYNYKAS